MRILGVAISGRTLAQLAVLVLSAAIALLVPFRLLAPETANKIIRTGAYWALLATFIATVWILVATLARRWPKGDFWRRHRWGLAAVAGLSGLLHVHEPHLHKVLYDEYTLSATAMNMHYHREAATPVRAHHINGQVSILNSFVDKRPFFYAFLLSLVHDVTGYRAENAFVFNGILTLVLLGLLYAAGCQIGGVRYGLLAALLLSCLPLLAFNVTGAGFEVLNLCMILALVHAALHYLRSEGSGGLALFILTAVLLAQVRYESILFVLVIPPVVLAKWVAEKEVRLDWFSAASPLLLLPPLVLNKVFFSNRGFLQLSSAKEKAFELQNFGPNIGEALYYLFNFDGDLTNSIFLSAVGCVALVFLAVRFATSGKQYFLRPGLPWVVFCTLVVVVANLVILFAYYWGQLTDPMVSRLSLPLHLAFALAPCFVCRVFFRGRPLHWGALALPVLAGFLFTLPKNARHTSTSTLISGLEIDWLRAYLEEETSEDTLVLAESSLPAVVHRRPAVPGVMVNKSQPQIKYVLEKGIYPEIVALQRLQIHPGTQREVDISNNPLDGCFQLEPIREIRFRPNIISRISRVVGVDLAAAEHLKTSTGGLIALIFRVDPSNALRRTAGSTPHELLGRVVGFDASLDTAADPPEGYPDDSTYVEQLLHKYP